MFFLILSIVIPLTTYFLFPFVVRYFSGKESTSRLPLLFAGACYLVSWYIPSPLIEGRNTAFMTHLVGGGVFSGCIWLYLANVFSWNTKGLRGVLSLFSIISTLGVANELFELIGVQLGLFHLDLSDTSWDLLANTLGAVLFWLVYVFICSIKRLQSTRV